MISANDSDIVNFVLLSLSARLSASALFLRIVHPNGRARTNR